MVAIIYFFLIHFNLIHASNYIELDYEKANKNIRNYSQVPKNELIFIKYAAIEPVYFVEEPLRGKGWNEPLDNQIILGLRKHESVYVDYFTDAKEGFYRKTDGYEVCGYFSRTFGFYKKLFKESKKRKNFFHNKKELFSIPAILSPVYAIAGFAKEKRHLFEKHKFDGSDYYNIKSILNDKHLYTAQVTGQGGILKELIYIDPHLDLRIKPIYAKRIYDFVASNSIQLTLMLRANRMDWADMSWSIDFYANKLGIDSSVVSFNKVSIKNPKDFTFDDILMSFVVCNGKDLSQLKKRIGIINNVIKNVRQDDTFWERVMRNFAKHTQTSYVPPEEFYQTKEMIDKKKELNQGVFDLYHNP